LGADFIAAQQRGGVAATAKHFPGLGSASRSQDTDEVPVRLPISLPQLRAIDEAPYRTAIAAGVKLVMVSWATYPALDPSRPAGLSPKVIGSELRQRLRFKGVTITDAIEAGALGRYGTTGSRSVQAIDAGADLILACATRTADNTPQTGLDAVHAIATALVSHKLNLLAIRRSTERVFALRSSP
jgi:beta-N-acetylhexosaminidase